MSGGDPYSAAGAAFIAGTLAGAFTGIISTKLASSTSRRDLDHDRPLFDQHSDNGRSNLSLLNQPTMFDRFQGFGIPGFAVPMVVVFIFVAALKIALDLFLHTRFGLAVRATGDNPADGQGSGG